MQIRLIVILSFLIYVKDCKGQERGLGDSAFISSFRETDFKFELVHPTNSMVWQFVAGSCIKSERDGGVEKPQLDLGVDSILAEINKIEPVNSTSSEKLSELISQLNDFRDSFGYSFHYKPSVSYTTSRDLLSEVNPFELYKADGFGTTCPPGYCNWFILHYSHSRINLIADKTKLFGFLGKVNNPHKAYLLLTATMFGSSLAYPQNGERMKFKKAGNKYYFLKRLRLSDCPIQNFDCLISVDGKGRVEMIDKVQFGEAAGCI